jgi:hypothetical protein
MLLLRTVDVQIASRSTHAFFNPPKKEHLSGTTWHAFILINPCSVGLKLLFRINHREGMHTYEKAHFLLAAI